jgi:hypothetical protein
VLTYSLGGGTGSGVGSQLLQRLRDTYGKSFIISTVVSASKAGDTPLQNFNSVFALQWLQVCTLHEMFVLFLLNY